MKKSAALFIGMIIALISCNLNDAVTGRVWNSESPFDADDYAKLVKKDGGEFRILQFTDTHQHLLR
jgi:hypothetical protein